VKPLDRKIPSRRGVLLAAGYVAAIWSFFLLGALGICVLVIALAMGMLWHTPIPLPILFGIVGLGFSIAAANVTYFIFLDGARAVLIATTNSFLAGKE
jgi:hypothetical protein